jgi:hypothetical protein
MKFISIIVLIVSSSFALGKEGENLSIKPIVGFERVQKLVPNPSMKTRLTYGIEALYKLPIGQAEAEVTKAQDDSIDLGVSPNASYKDE